MTGTYSLTWYGCDLRTGAVAEELRSLRPTQPLSRRGGASTSTMFELALAGAPDEWESATDPGRTMLVAADADTGALVWCGITLQREGGSSDTVSLAAATPEAYFDRRYPGDYSVTATDQSTIMAALSAPAATSGPLLEWDTTLSGTSIDYTVRDADDRSILSCLQEISAMSGGPEWTIDPVWADAAQTTVKLVVRIRPLLGVQDANPNAVFDLPGCIATYKLAEAYDRDRGATRTVARGEQTSGTRASSTVHTATDLIAAGWCLWERRWTPASGITSTDQLDRHAAEALDLMSAGSRAWSLEAVASRAPRLGTDWGLGDTVRVEVDASPRHPDGATVVARAYAWSLDAAADRLSPILLEDA